LTWQTGQNKLIMTICKTKEMIKMDKTRKSESDFQRQIYLIRKQKIEDWLLGVMPTSHNSSLLKRPQIWKSERVSAEHTTQMALFRDFDFRLKPKAISREGIQNVTRHSRIGFSPHSLRSRSPLNSSVKHSLRASTLFWSFHVGRWEIWNFTRSLSLKPYLAPPNERRSFKSVSSSEADRPGWNKNWNISCCFRWTCQCIELWLGYCRNSIESMLCLIKHEYSFPRDISWTRRTWREKLIMAAAIR
jgi:hypothetical protein